MPSPSELRARILLGGDTPERRAIFERHFARRAPRKLVCAAQRLPLDRLRVLDVGCGYGVYLAHFSPQSLGVDRSPERVEFARSIGLAAEVRDVERAGWERDLGTFDVVWLCDILVHLARPEEFLAGLACVLAPPRQAGRLLITEWLWPERRALANLLAACIPGGREVLHDSGHIHCFSRRSLAELCERSGLAIESSYNHTFASATARALVESFWPPRTIVARRR